MYNKAVRKLNEITLFHRPSKANQTNKEVETRIEQLAQMTEGRLFMASAIFPFDLFPNKIFIEQKQVIVIYRQDLFSSQDYHILIEDILMPVVEISLFFATLKFELGPGGFQQNPPPIRFLKKRDALRIKQIIVGLLICHKEKIDLSKMTPAQILKNVEEIGRTKMD